MVTPFNSGVQLSLCETAVQISLQAYSTEMQVCVVRKHSQIFCEIFQVAWMPRILKTIHISVCIDIYKHLELLCLSGNGNPCCYFG